MNILFVCKHNRYRSKVAEALLNKYKRKQGTNVLSSGVELDFLNPRVSDNVIKVLGEREAKVVDERVKAIDSVLVRWADRIIIVADNVNPEVFPKKKIEVWPIKDVDQGDYEGIEKGIDAIAIKVRSLIERLNL